MTDVVVIGGGIMGTALCHELARRGVPVTLVESTQLCGGSSGRNAGGVRQQFSHPLNVALARRTVERMSRFADEFGVDIGLRQVGYLFLLSDPAVAAAMRETVAMQNRLGVPTRWVEPDEITALVPGIDGDGLAGGAYCPTDGYLDPHSVVTGYADAARRAGATIRQFLGATGVEVSGGRARAVTLADGTRIPCGIVVNCAGAWAGEVAARYGERLPIRAWRSQCFHVTGVTLPAGCPMTIDFDRDKAYFHPDGPDVVAGMDRITESEPAVELPFDWSACETLVEHLVRRMPLFADARIAGGWAGLLECTPDENPIVGWTGPENCYTAAGFSGHGLSLAPALAAEVAAELLGERTGHDLTPFRPERFAAGAAAAGAPEVLAMR